MSAEDKVIFKRLQVFFITVVFLSLTLVGRLAYLQVIEGEYYQRVSEENRIRNVSILPPRGEIFSRDGTVLAKSVPGYTVSLMDVGREDHDKVVSYLSEFLDLEKDFIEDRIQSQRFRQFEPVRLKSGVSYEEIAHLSEMRTELPGVVLEVQPKREYPQNEYLSHILGYTGEVTRSQLEQGLSEKGYRMGDIVGRAGLEKTYQETLIGKAGSRHVEVNRFGRIINDLGIDEPEPGENIHLTIDFELQRFLKEILEDKMEEIAEDEPDLEDFLGNASGVVMDPNSGEILSMVSIPKYNPNEFFERYHEYLEDPLNPLRHRAISETYPPGSTYKMATAVAALEEGVVTRSETINDQGRHWRPPNVRNFRDIAYGRINIVDALRVSSNVFFAEMGHRLGIDELSRWSGQFGFGVPTGLRDITGERAGTVAGREFKERFFLEPEQQVWYPGETIIAAMGQGYHTMTPIQMANYTAMLANEGTHYRPHLVNKVTDMDGNIVEEKEPDVMNTLDVNDQTWETVKEGMRQVAREGGTAWYHFRDLDMDVALKTGTAEVTGRPAHAWIVGFAPLEDPEIAFSLLVEHGGSSSRVVPTARQLIDYYFDLGPDEEEDVEEDASLEDASLEGVS